MADVRAGRASARRRTTRRSDSPTELDDVKQVASRGSLATRSRSSTAQTSGGSATRRRTAVRGRADRPSRLRFLLSILLVTTLMLFMLQAYRQVYGSRRRRQSALSGPLRSRIGLAYDRLRGGGGRRSDAAAESMASGAATAAHRTRRLEDEENPLSWTKYISAMRHHFRDTLDENAIKESKEQTNANSGGNVVHDSAGGMAVVPGEGVVEHRVEREPEPVPGKSREEALRDRRAALEELDQETLKAMFDALYGRDGLR